MNRTINIEQCQGYIWKSDADKPQVFNGCACNLVLDDSANPFVLEAMLYDAQTQDSYMIKYVDGRHLIQEYNLFNKFDDVTEISVLPNRMEGIPELKLKQFWKKTPDKLCNGFETLTPAEIVFAGFKKVGE
ncbi:hypothetical protein FSU_2045 [Fibrobacter succinogenes subsp. succinogenes S85]|uniref:Uncharacterized protein n=1 Tax=Fibrobacter succinogenes (strain ATCC 19169 / S85) TaxID=59374 RepID=C9RRH0_FIBSS|nr:TIGR04423 family type III CRISPR-associated protein [Fibrobacter succinogenes]ACX75156.1 hypothetical protein Fisuc_1561 [Fibrobacter succinogenes subsp. succinogenes S85]ADL26002.1 hypothetical protein FSU_2045 [Fibrobacter succinogenes subsp. succinogenes S85]